MRRTLSISLALLAGGAIAGCANDRHTPASGSRPALTRTAEAVRDSDALSNLNHPITTSSAEAQRRFNEGLTLIYAFNHDEAVRSFEKALKADPNCAMAQWGIAYAVGPNYNAGIDAEREKKGYEHIQLAKQLAEKNASAAEKDYIQALSHRFSNAAVPDFKAIAEDYAVAAGELAKKYPDDLEAATLYADAMMNLKPWALYTKDNKPVEGTETIVATLESVLKRDPDHIGANHLYIHAVEASKHPERALEAAARLPSLAPDCGHLVHMPSHIYARVGDHESAATSNEAAVEVDRAYFKKHPEGKGGFYEMMYYPHNIHFCAYAEAWQGNYKATQKWAKTLYEHAQPHVAHMPMMEGFTAVPVALEVKFRRWDDILKGQAPDQKTMPITTAFYHYARGMAFASRGDIDQANSERGKFVAIRKSLPADTMFGMLNKADHVLNIAEHTLDGKIAAKQKKFDDAARLMREAAALEDDLTYMEPPDWLTPTRETLGGILLQANKPAEAEKVFRSELDDSPRNGRSLYGLWQALKAQNKTHDAEQIERQFKTAWKNADTKLSVEDL